MKKKAERVTYARKRLLGLIESRKLRSWCEENGVNHSTAYRLALGERIPTYKTIASMCHLIAPIEWLFFTDEKLPFKPRLLPQWPCKEPCKFVRERRYSYKKVAEEFDVSPQIAYDIFVSYRLNPNISLMRAACGATDPTEFFVAGKGEITPLSNFIPDRGDLVSVSGRTVFVITKKEFNKKSKSFSGCLVTADSAKGIKLKGNVKGVVNDTRLYSFPLIKTEPCSLLEKASEELTDKVMEEVRKTLA